MNEQDLQYVALLMLQLQVEIARRDRRVAELEKELADLRKLQEPAGEEN